MPTPDCYVFMDAILEFVVRTSSVKFAYLDYGCQYRAHWQKVVHSLAGMERSSPQILVPWFHAEAHVEGCKYCNSGKYTEGAGRVVGECCEQLWAELKVERCQNWLYAFVRVSLACILGVFSLIFQYV